MVLNKPLKGGDLRWRLALVEDEISKFDRVEMVFDRYFEFSTKNKAEWRSRNEISC